MKIESKILVMDDNMLSRCILRHLQKEGYKNAKIPTDVDYMNMNSVEDMYLREKPEYVFCFAGPHGGIQANIQHPAEFIYKNLQIQNNIIHGAYLNGVKKLLFMVGACVYPKECKQPMCESDFMTGKMEETSVAYSMARAAGIEMCLAYNRQYNTHFIPAPLCNYFGEEDDFSESGHVLASLLRKMHCAKIEEEKSVCLYGTGKPLRQFMYVEDIARAAVLIMNKYQSSEMINIGGGEEISIAMLAELVKDITEYKGKIEFDSTKPDGTMRKLCDGTKLRNIGFVEQYSLREGIQRTYDWYIDNIGR